MIPGSRTGCDSGSSRSGAYRIGLRREAGSARLLRQAVGLSAEFPHVEVSDATGQRVDPFGNPVTRKSPGKHMPTEWDSP
jgi:hypothetical protein